MRGGVTVCAFSVVIVKCKNLQFAVLVERCSQVFDFAVYLCNTGCFIEPHAEIFGDFHGGNAAFILFDDSAFESYINHIFTS